MAIDQAARLYQAFVDQDPASAIKIVERVRANGVAQKDLFDISYVPALALLGGAWAEGTIDEVAFTQAAVIAEQVISFVIPPVLRPDTGITVLVAVMHRDRHTVMKNIVAGALKQAGYRVNDLGCDVRPADIVERIGETGSRIVIVFAEMMATARSVRRVREMLESEGRGDVVLLVGGGPFATDLRLAREVGANGVITSAEGALKVLARVRTDLLRGGRA